MYLHELLEGWVDDAPQIRLNGIRLDNRSIEAGEAFVAVNGQADHARAAVGAGAVAVIHDSQRTLPQLDVPSIRIDGLAHKLGELASRYYAAPSELMTIAGVTGRDGKSSVAHYLAQSWQRVYGNAGVVGTPGDGPVGVSQDAEHATPDAFQLQQVLAGCASSGIERLAMEVPSLALEQKRLETVQFDAAIFTDSQIRHDAGRSDQTGRINAPRRLFTDYAPSFAIINHDDVLGRRWFKELNDSMQVLSFGLEKGAELSALVQTTYTNGMTFRIDGPWGSERVHTTLRGEDSLHHLLATAGTLALLGMPWHRVLHQLEVMKPFNGRAGRLRRDHGAATADKARVQQPDTLEVAA